MTRGEALKQIRALVAAGKVVCSGHALDRAAERGFSEDDLWNAAAHPKTAVHQQHNDRWKVTGPSLDGDDCRIIVVIEAELVIVTTWDPNSKDD
jgi:hypothetical protein